MRINLQIFGIHLNINEISGCSLTKEISLEKKHWNPHILCKRHTFAHILYHFKFSNQTKICPLLLLKYVRTQ